MKSTDVIQPLAMASVFAEDIYSASGTTNFEIPAATSTAANDTCVLDDGFLPITSEQLPPNGNGIAPARKNFNGLFYLSTDQRVFLQNGGFITFDATVSTQIGGYPAGAILNYIDSNGRLGFVKSLIDDNTNNFVTTPSYIDGTNWELVELANVQSQLAEKADIDLANTTPSQTFKDMSMSWGMVDYANGIDLQGLSTYTCPDDGFVNISGLTAATTVVLKRNDIPIGNACYQNYVSASCFVPVYKDDVLTIFVTQTSAATTFPNYSTFYPMKGAN